MKASALSSICLLLAACSQNPGFNTSRANDAYAELSPSQIYVRKGVQYMEAGNYEVALHDLEHAIALDRKNGEAYNALAVLHQKLDNPAAAQGSFEKVLSMDPENHGARNNYGRLLCGQGKYNEAMEQFQKVIASRLYNYPWIPLTNAGLCARGAGHAADAEQYLRRALEVNPQFGPALLELARISRDTGQFMSARAFVQRYHGAEPPSAESLWLAVEVERDLGETDLAREYAMNLANRFPDSKEAALARRQVLGH